MKYSEFRERSSFAHEELLAFAHGTLFDDAPIGFDARLPLPPMLMLDRITQVERSGARGRIVGERDVRLDDWFFQCHFLSDPVQPGCLGVDGVLVADGALDLGDPIEHQHRRDRQPRVEAQRRVAEQAPVREGEQLFVREGGAFAELGVLHARRSAGPLPKRTR